MLQTFARALFATFLTASVLGLGTGTAAAAAGAELVTKPSWTRPLATIPGEFRGSLVLEALSDGTLLVRNGERIMLLDARGTTLWSEPNVDGAIVAGSMVIFRRSDTVFAVRRDDAGVLWKRACAKPQYLVNAGDRLLTMCGNVSTVLLARTGAVLSFRTLKESIAQLPFSGARRLNDDYVMVMNVFDGAWLGEAYSVVDAHTGAFLWAATDCDVIDVSPTTVSITPYPSMLPWAATGTVSRRRLSDGKVLSTERYAPPRGGDLEDRGNLVITQAAAYVTTASSATYRFRRGSRTPELLHLPQVGKVIALGRSAFLFDGTALNDGEFYIDRPSGSGFSLTAVGHHRGVVGTMSPMQTASYVTGWSAVRLGNRIAVPDGGVLRFYDELGRVEMSVRPECTDPAVAMTRTTLFVQCAVLRMPGTLVAYARPE